MLILFSWIIIIIGILSNILWTNNMLWFNSTSINKTSKQFYNVHYLSTKNGWDLAMLSKLPWGPHKINIVQQYYYFKYKILYESVTILLSDAVREKFL